MIFSADDCGLERILEDIHAELHKNPLQSATFWGLKLTKITKV